MSIPNTFIIIKNQPKALQIEKIDLGANGAYHVKFKSSPSFYHYRFDDVVWIKNSIRHDPMHCKVFVNGKILINVADIRSFQHYHLTHWRITFNNGFVQDYMHGTINVIESCIADEVAKNSFEYLKRVAYTNDLGKDEDHGGILPNIYEHINFIDEHLSIAPYLNPQKFNVGKLKPHNLIFPFGCNGSQEKAVTAAFENQLSVIQGPPGTGKTQTILNIIANILMQDKSVIVVSNNNSATTNVQEKLQKEGLDFIVAALGKKENKEHFVDNQPIVPTELSQWQLEPEEKRRHRQMVSDVLSRLRRVFALQENRARSKQELKEVELEWNHFKQDNGIDEQTYPIKPHLKSKKLMRLWLQYQAYSEGDVMAHSGFLAKILEYVKWLCLNIARKHTLGISSSLYSDNLPTIILEIQALYYQVRINELKKAIADCESELNLSNEAQLKKELTSASVDLLKGTLYDKYYGNGFIRFADATELKRRSDDLLKQYPVILSTTFSARTCLSDRTVFDYLIMDEASQVSIETGALSMTCARNAVVVGDTRQLPNVVTADIKMKLDAIFNEFKVPDGYDSSKYSFLQSVCKVIPDVNQTLLKEHYRCHPKIINFCNQKFYGGNLLIMTEDNNEENVMAAIKTVPGNHCRGHYNQREIDVVMKEVLPNIEDSKEVGIITPYNSQVDAFNRQITSLEAATVHKYQGREKDTIIMSTVDDQITEFSDDPNLLNVAVSRAKKRFCIVLSGNKQELKGNISDLVDYINYNNLSVTESKISSIFDYLYSQYTEQRMAFLANSKKISEFDSENLTYKLLTDIISNNDEFKYLNVLCHTPIRNFIRDWSFMTEDEKRYISNISTHVDFLLTNRVTKKPVLAIETDGYKYHNNKTEQHKRDLIKDHILEVYELPLLRLSTTGSNEKEKIINAIKNTEINYEQEH